MPIWKKGLSLEVLNNDFPDGAATNSGIEYTDFGDDYITARMPVDERTRQPYGILHGGASCLLAETVGSHASSLCIDMDKQYCLGLEINANHIRSVSEGFVYGTAKPMHLGRSTHVWEIMIRNEAGKTVCISRLTMMVKDQE